MKPKTFKPTGGSFWSSLLWGIAPAIVGISIAYFNYERGGWLAIISAIVGSLISLFLIMVTLNVHGKSISLDDNAISISGPGGGTRLLWSSVIATTLRERHSTGSRTDRFLKMESSDGRALIYSPSILSPENEKELLQEIQRHVQVTVIRDE